jgi:hypothetical protein
LLAYVHVRGGHEVPGNIGEFVSQTLYNGNPQLPASVRIGLQHGDLTPWAPFIALPPPKKSASLLGVEFALKKNPQNLYGPPLFGINSNAYDEHIVNYV